ncbi:TPR-like protein [Trametopsis cervina]|nr:TPR-like protein [Trametopsis cervina]
MAFPQPQNVSIDEKLAAFDSVPLFMKTLPDDVENDALNAIQSLVHDGTPDEVAENFKNQGNEYFKGKRYRDALGFYTQGIGAFPTNAVLQEALLCNRAACNLELKNYGSVLKDCSKALSLNPRSSKALYRSASALTALERYEESLNCCDLCLEFDPDNTGISTLREKTSRLKETRDRKTKEKEERLKREIEEKRQLQLAYKARNLIVMISANDITGVEYQPHFDPEDSSKQTLIFPALFLYPQYATSDIVPEFVEDTPFSAHISIMFPPQAAAPDWDKNKEYVDGHLVIYAVTHRQRLLKVGKKMTLRDLFQASKAKEGEPADGLELKDNCLTFVVLPKGSVEQKWIDDFKAMRGKAT